MKIFLKLKHWQIFLLVMLPSILVGVLGMFPVMFAGLLLRLFPIVLAILVLFLLGWCYAVGSSCHKMVPPPYQGNFGMFRAFCTTALFVYMMLCVIVFIPALGIRMPEPPGIVVLLFVLLCMFSQFCLLYSLWFAVKAFRVAEHYKQFGNNPYFATIPLPNPVAEFFMLWFFPVGIWFLQPRVQKLISGR
jgi:hypothetical protein